MDDNFHTVLLYLNNKKLCYKFPKKVSTKIDNHYNSKEFTVDKVKFKIKINNESMKFLKVIQTGSVEHLQKNPDTKYLELLVDFIIETGLFNVTILNNYLESNISQLISLKTKLSYFYKPIFVGSLIRLCYSPKNNEYLGLDVNNLNCRLNAEAKTIIDSISKENERGEREDRDERDERDEQCERDERDKRDERKERENEILIGIATKISADNIKSTIVDPTQVFYKCRCLVDKSKTKKPLCENYWIVLMDKDNQSKIQIKNITLLQNLTINRKYEKRKLIMNNKILCLPKKTCKNYPYCYGHWSNGDDFIQIGGYQMFDNGKEKYICGKGDSDEELNESEFVNKNNFDINSLSTDGIIYFEKNVGYVYIFHCNDVIFGRFIKLNCHSENEFLQFWEYNKNEEMNYCILLFNNSFCYHEIKSIRDVSQSNVDDKSNFVPKCNRITFDPEIYIDLSKIKNFKFNKKYNSIAFSLDDDYDDEVNLYQTNEILYFSKEDKLYQFNHLFDINFFLQNLKNDKIYYENHIDFMFTDDNDYLIVLTWTKINDKHKTKFILLDFVNLKILKMLEFPIFINIVAIEDIIPFISIF